MAFFPMEPIVNHRLLAMVASPSVSADIIGNALKKRLTCGFVAFVFALATRSYGLLVLFCSSVLAQEVLKKLCLWVLRGVEWSEVSE